MSLNKIQDNQKHRKYNSREFVSQMFFKSTKRDCRGYKKYLKNQIYNRMIKRRHKNRLYEDKMSFNDTRIF